MIPAIVTSETVESGIDIEVATTMNRLVQPALGRTAVSVYLQPTLGRTAFDISPEGTKLYAFRIRVIQSENIASIVKIGQQQQPVA